MSSRMQRNLGLLELLYKSTPSMRRVIVGKASSDFIKALCEIALNVLCGNIPLQYKQLKKNSRHQISSRQISQTFKKEKKYQPVWRFFIASTRSSHTIYSLSLV